MPVKASLLLWITIGCGGFLGAILRYALSGWVIQRFPMGTLAVNLTGCLLIGLLMALFERSNAPAPLLQGFLITGVMGALTTFSTFSYQSVILLKQAGPRLALANISLNLVLCLAATWIGLVVGEALSSTRTS